MTERDDLTLLRRYTRHQAAERLDIPETWLKVWVTDGKVPHQRSGKPGPRQRGVWFTYDNIVDIGRSMPALMTVRQANHRAESPADPCPAEATTVLLGPEVNAYEQFAGLRSLRAGT